MIFLELIYCNFDMTSLKLRKENNKVWKQTVQDFTWMI